MRSQDDVDEGVACLAKVEPRFAQALVLTGVPEFRRRDEGFTALLDIIVSQQISVAAGNAIWGRIVAAGLDHAAALKASSDGTLRKCGLSQQKVKYAKSLAASSIDYAQLAQLPESDVVRQLTELPGIGRWSADIYCMFSLGRADIFPAGDLALQVAARHVFELEDRPRESQLRGMSEAWRPWRSVAALLLWSYYRHVKNREGTRQ